MCGFVRVLASTSMVQGVLLIKKHSGVVWARNAVKQGYTPYLRPAELALFKTVALLDQPVLFNFLSTLAVGTPCSC